MRTLVLNAGYEPLAVVTFRRGLLLVLAGKASILAEDDEPVMCSGGLVARPSVILLHRYIKVPYRGAAHVSRRGVLRRDGHQCGYCGRHASTVDHVHPRSLGGAETWENLVACCLACNHAKGNKTLRQLGWKLRVKPMPPRGPQWYITELERPAPQWHAFLGSTAA